MSDLPSGGQNNIRIILLQHLASVGSLDLREISEPTRQRLVDLAMTEPALVDVDADPVFLTVAGESALMTDILRRDRSMKCKQRRWGWRGWWLMLTWGQVFGVGVTCSCSLHALRVNGVSIIIGPLAIDVVPPPPRWLADAS